MNAAISAARHLLQRLQPLVPRGRGVTVLAYHLVGGGTRSPIDVPLPAFEAQMEELRREATVMPLAEAAAALASGEALPERAAVITFDDAYENFYTTAYPVLTAHEIPATLYVPVGFVEGTGGVPIAGTDGLPACSWEQLREMQASGFISIGSHTLSHPSLPLIPHAEAEREIRDSRAALEDRLGASVSSFCYPRALWTDSLDRVVAETYETAVVGGGVQPRHGRYHPHRIERVALRHDSPARLAPMLDHAVWLEEWLADRVRRARLRLPGQA